MAVELVDPAAFELIWAKSDRDGGDPVSLIQHGLASGLAARTLLEGALTVQARSLGGGLGLSAGDAIALAAGVVALHDIGKATPTFQSLWSAGAQRLKGARFPFSPALSSAPHGFVSATLIAELLESCGAPRVVARRIGRAVGAHHGTFPGVHLPVPDDGDDPERVWAGARQHIIDCVVGDVVGRDLPVPTVSDDVAVALLAGLTTFADWLASDRDVLGSIAAEGLTAGLVAGAVVRVPIEAPHRVVDASFGEMFGFEPRGAQVFVDEVVAPQLASSGPALVVIEDATGAGKTEAAFRIVQAGLRSGARGAYVALPTRATSQQAYRRLASFLASALPGRSQAHLLHAGAGMVADYRAIREGRHTLSPREVADEEGVGVGSVEAAAWFCRSKRGLLSTFAVGTVDQAMLGVLQAKFATLRLSGLAGKVLVLDEVHAYDGYMIAIIERLVSWAAAMGSTVVLLSATLPAGMKQRLVEAFGAAPIEEDDALAYPSVTYVARGRSVVERVESAMASRRSVGIQRVRISDGANPAAACRGEVAKAAAAGANVLIVMNTVRRAQEMYRGLLDTVDAASLRLLHARFRHRERAAREDVVLAAFGRDGSRPVGQVVVATQVIEQSLDVDFDVLVSDLAPVDLLLQRIGRLQRHARHGSRPVGYDEAGCRMILLDPPVVAGVPVPDRGTLAVYREHALLRTLIALDGRDAIAVPDEVRDLVEAVYDDRPAPASLSRELADRWGRSRAELDREVASHEGMAKNRIVGAPGEESIDRDLSESVGDDDQPPPGSLAQTRLGSSCSLVVLTADEARLATADARVGRVARELLERSLSVSLPPLVAALLREPVPPAWRSVPLVSRHRLLILDADLRTRVGGAVLTLDPDLGLVIDWKG